MILRIIARTVGMRHSLARAESVGKLELLDHEGFVVREIHNGRGGGGDVGTEAAWPRCPATIIFP